MNALLLLIATLFTPVPCETWALHEDESLTCDGLSYPEGAYVLICDEDDGDIMGASAWRTK